jgi:hypothetical protein
MFTGKEYFMIKQGMPFAIVHHANQYLITNGYLNRPGISEIIGSPDASCGLRAVMHLHSLYNIPFHLHISGTFIEACAWYDPLFLEEIKDLQAHGLVEIIGSTYAQNIMTLFDYKQNKFQIQEELDLIHTWIHPNLQAVKGFWVPERVWNTDKLAKLLTDSTLKNHGFQYVLVDDRLLLQNDARKKYDQKPIFQPELFQAYRIQNGNGLIALPLSHPIRISVPFEKKIQAKNFSQIFDQLYKANQQEQNLIAIYGDDMEKVAAIPPWNPQALIHYQHFLDWLTSNKRIEPVLLRQWLSNQVIESEIKIGTGSYRELATEFGAGEDYQNWANSKAWAPYQSILNKTWKKLDKLSTHKNVDCSLLTLAHKHFSACTYETAWHDAVNSIHSDGNQSIAMPAPWARALASHAKTSSILIKAAIWKKDHGSTNFTHCDIADIDDDGHKEVILRNHLIAAVFSPNFGGRLIYLISYQSNQGALVVGNPSDDWNWLEEPNDFMDSPMNHPGAFADHRFEHDKYKIHSLSANKQRTELILMNNQKDSPAFGLIKRFTIEHHSSQIHASYEQIPPSILPLSLDIGLSPDYLQLLRNGRRNILPYQHKNRKGFQNGNLIAWMEPKSNHINWIFPRNPIFGHGFCLSFHITSSSAALCLGIATHSNRKEEEI